LRFLCQKVSVSFESAQGSTLALDRVSLEILPGEFVAVVGPSGCGKTTLLRTIAGLLKPAAGSVDLESIGARALMVYQENSLFPWMNVLDNACFGLEAQRVPREEREARALPLLRRFGLGGRERAWPHQLSAGMKQRVAVIRSFLSRPDLLLMDEPFGALDCHMRGILQRELLDLWEQERATVLFVTHDVDEALLLSDRVLVMSGSPGTVRAEISVDLERPREADVTLTERFLDLKRRVWGNMLISRPEATHAG